MGKDKRPWRKLVKKLRRKRIRSGAAQDRDRNANTTNVEIDLSSDSEDEEALNHQINEAKWLEAERVSQLKFEMEKAEERRRIQLQEEEKERIRKEWDELEAKREAHEKEKKRLEEERREKQEKEYNEFLDFLSGDIETPPLPFLMPEDATSGEKVICPFFSRTAACRFSVNCTRAHPRPILSQTILIPNFFSHFALEQALLDEYDTDLNLEYEDSELYKTFLEFYDDVMPEFKKIGDVIQFKVCCNLEAHLRGNVYVQYKDIRQAVEAFRTFNGRFYNGRQLSLQFAKIDSWRSAICGLFQRKRCPQKRSCYFLHVFRNPTKEFVAADNDWKEVARKNSKYYSDLAAAPSTRSTSTERPISHTSSRQDPAESTRKETSKKRPRSRSRDRDRSRLSRRERDSPKKRLKNSYDSANSGLGYWDRPLRKPDRHSEIGVEIPLRTETVKETNADADAESEAPPKIVSEKSKKKKPKKDKKEKHRKHKKKKKKDHKKSKKKSREKSLS